jgi:hypothetical protein
MDFQSEPSVKVYFLSIVIDFMGIKVLTHLNSSFIAPKKKIKKSKVRENPNKAKN